MRRRRLLTLPAAGLLVLGAAAPTAIAQSNGDTLVHRASVLTEVSASGEPGTSRVFTQLTVPSGSDEVVLPGQSTSGLRGLSGLGPRVDGDALRFDGSGSARTVADHTADLPVSIEITYAIDGREVEPSAVRGHTGEVAVTYTVRNLTAAPTELTVVDGDGTERTETVDVAVPMVGSLALTLPDTYTDVVAPGGVVVGDGRGGTVVNWSLLLFSPLGSETQSVTWTGQARDAIVPAASLQVLPVTPDSFGSLGSTEEAYGGAVASTTELTEGAREIDTNLQRLADGAAELLDGLTQLRDGADELAAGLVEASTGAGDLSDGLGQARAGAGELSAGLGDLASGAGQLSAGVGSARAGAAELGSGLGDLSAGAAELSAGLGEADAGGQELTAGLGQLSAGAGELSAGAGDLATGAATLDQRTGELVTGAGELSAGAAQVLGGIQQLAAGLQGPDGLPAALAGITRMQAGIGAVGQTGTLLDGMNRLELGMVDALTGIGDPSTPGTTMRYGLGQVQGGLDNPLCSLADADNPANPCGVTQLNDAIGTQAGTLLADLTDVLTDLDGIDETALLGPDQATLTSALATLTADATAAGAIQAYAGGVTTVVGRLQAGLSQVDAGLVSLAAGIGDPATADTMRNGVFRLTAGVSNPACDPANPTNPANPCGLLQGLAALQAGLQAAAADVASGLGSTTTPGTLLYGASQVAGGSSQLSAGAQQLRTQGTAPLAAGAGDLQDGAAQVAAGAAAALDGGEDLADGLGRLAGGGLELNAGAGRAAAGASELTAGLGQLDAGGAELSAGAAEAAAGGADLNNGLVQLDDGGARLAEGLGDAVDGSERLADGLVDAADGGAQVADGTVQLGEEGTTVLADNVSAATVDSSLQLEQVRAVAARGVAGEGLPYPTAEGAEASAVYQFDLAGVGSTEGPGAGGRLGIGLLALLVAVGAGLATRRRVLVLHDIDQPATDRVDV